MSAKHLLRTAALAAALLLPAAGCSKKTVVHEFPAASQLDLDLRAALQDAGVAPVPAPAPEPAALVELGRALFFDKVLSGNLDISCATCHHPAAATGDALPVSIGEGGEGLAATRVLANGVLIPRNAPHVFNAGVAGVDTMFWDSRVSRDPVTGSLETPEPGLNGPAPPFADLALPLRSALAAQAMFPVAARDEMRGQPGANDIADAADNEEVWALLMERLVGTNGGTVGGIEEYRQLFLAAFPGVTNPDDLTFGHAARAIAAFEREAWTALGTPFDAYLAGDDSALSENEKRGALLFFGKARCDACHNGPLLSDFLHHACATPQVGPGKLEPSEDRGRALVTGDPADTYRFRTPTLRNVALTGPWTHAGAFTSLEDVARHMLSPVDSLWSYDGSELPALFAATVDFDLVRQSARADACDPTMLPAMDLTAAELDDLIAFLYALTDPDSISLLGEIPDEVPSGLPVVD